MRSLATVLGLSADTWTVLVASGALVVSIIGTSVARGSANASARSAGAAEASAQHAEKSAEAAERSAVAAEGSLAIEQDRARHEARERTDRDAPHWDATASSEQAWWISDDNHFSGTLRNGGKVRAVVTGVELELPTGGRVSGRFRSDPPGPGDGGFVSELGVHPGGVIAVEFETSDGSLGAGMRGDTRPRVGVLSRSEDLGWEGERTIEFLRRSGGVSSALRWQPRATA
jgi:hypothetical protein